MKISTAIVTVVAAFASFANAKESATTDTYDYVIVGGGVGGTYTQPIILNINNVYLTMFF